MSLPSKIRDPIHGFIELDEDELNIINTPIFQRLRGIRQLALANLVYPGAVHTRFEHSLGTCHVAGRMAKVLDLNDSDTKDVRLAALLHDLGHGPFSHVSDDLLELYSTDEILNSSGGKKENIHELITADLIRTDRDLVKYISENKRGKLARLLLQEHGEPILKSIVSGPLDADKQDYLLRDSYYCGVKYGLFDIDQLHRELCKRQDPYTQAEDLRIKHDGILAVEQFIIGKYLITTQVYRHRVRLITDEMIIRAITLGIDKDNIEELHSLYAYDGSPKFLINYARWDDARVMATFQQPEYKEKLCYDLFDRLAKRRLHKLIYYMRIDEFPAEARDKLREICRPENISSRRKLETQLRDIVFLKNTDNKTEADLIINVYRTAPIHNPSDIGEGGILVDRAPMPISFEQESRLFNSLDEGLRTSFVDVYAAVKFDSDTGRRRLINSVEAQITEAIEEYFSGGSNDADTNA